MDEALMEQQRQAYKVEGVDESEPAVDLRKRKAEGQDVSCPGRFLRPLVHTRDEMLKVG